MNTLQNSTLGCLIACTLWAAPVTGDDERMDFGFEASAGYKYDSNVNLSEIDDNTEQADTALQYKLGADLRARLADNLTLYLDYGYSATRYQELSGYDLAIHQAQARISYRLGAFDTGLAARHFHALVDGDGFLDINQGAVSVARMLDDTWYLRAAFTHSDKTYADYPARDADNEALDADVYYLLDGMNRYVSMGMRVDSEDAVSDEFDYVSGNLRLAYGHQLPLGSRNLKLKGQLKLEKRDYQHLTASLGEKRDDERLRAGLTATLPLSRYLEMSAEAEYANNASNLPSADYSETVFSVNFATAF